MRKPSPAMMVALASLFVALGGVGIAANGQSLILGKPDNSASAKTGLSAPINDKALAITNTGTGTSATALGLTVASGHVPFTVNSPKKVTNLNADQLDGIDSAALQKRVSATCATGTAIRAISSSGSVTCQDTRTQLVSSVDIDGSKLPYSFQVTTHGGPLLMFLSGSGWRTAAEGQIELLATIPDQPTAGAYAHVYTNEAASHKALIPDMSIATGLAAGTHTVSLTRISGTFDGNDRVRLTLLELPH